ncbi:MAG: M23 family metallopeptidase [Cellulosilyticaceae bacterium]
MWVQKENSRGQFNIIIVPSNGGAATTFNLSGAMLRWGTGLIIMILFFLLSSTCFFYNKYTYVSRQLVMTQKPPIASVITKTVASQIEQEIGEKIQEEKRPIKKEASASKVVTAPIEEAADVEVYLIPGEESVDFTLARKIRLKEERIKEQQLYIPTFKPCEGIITSPFGDRNNPFNQGSTETHKGIDVANSIGTSIHAAAKGVVIESGYSNGYGYVVYIDHGNGIETRYAHNSKLYVKEGDLVEKGEEIAGMGSTGNSTGSHLHFEIRENGVPVNPRHLF